MPKLHSYNDMGLSYGLRVLPVIARRNDVAICYNLDSSYRQNDKQCCHLECNAME